MSQWNPELRDKEGASLYGSMYRRVQAAGGKVAGILWYQGESDANPKAVDAFRSRFESFIASVRRDLARPDLPFYYVQLGRHINLSNQAEWNKVQEVQRRIEAVVPHTGVVPAVDLPLDDGIHISASGLQLLGVRLAALAAPHAKNTRGPRVGSAVWNAGKGTIRLTFTEVNGALQSAGRPSGFSIHDADGVAVPLIYRTDLEGNEVVLNIGGKLPPGATVSYGTGKDPYCNLTDGASMGMLAFMGLPITQ
jgi:sialate O-acetylesterase